VLHTASKNVSDVHTLCATGSMYRVSVHILNMVKFSVKLDVTKT
jgi:hypothetical protein